MPHHHRRRRCLRRFAAAATVLQSSLFIVASSKLCSTTTELSRRCLHPVLLPLPLMEGTLSPKNTAGQRKRMRWWWLATPLSSLPWVPPLPCCSVAVAGATPQPSLLSPNRVVGALAVVEVATTV